MTANLIVIRRPVTPFTITSYLSSAIMHIDQIDAQPKMEPNIPYISHINGPRIQVSKNKFIVIIGQFVAIIEKSEKAKFRTSKLAGVRRVFVVENIQTTNPFPQNDIMAADPKKMPRSFVILGSMAGNRFQ